MAEEKKPEGRPERPVRGLGQLPKPEQDSIGPVGGVVFADARLMRGAPEKRASIRRKLEELVESRQFYLTDILMEQEPYRTLALEILMNQEDGEGLEGLSDFADQRVTVRCEEAYRGLPSPENPSGVVKTKTRAYKFGEQVVETVVTDPTNVRGRHRVVEPRLRTVAPGTVLDLNLYEGLIVLENWGRETTEAMGLQPSNAAERPFVEVRAE